MNLIPTKIKEIKIVEPKVFGDARGFFFESYKQASYSDIGIDADFVQDNISRSKYGVIRGLHYQLKFPQGKLVTVTRGEVFDVAVDVRVGSPTFGKWEGVILNDENHRQIYIPPGFAHGFCVLSEVADFYYKCTDYYHPDDEYGIIWNDSEVGVAWTKLSVIPNLSAKDAASPKLSEVQFASLPSYKP